jgi:hypothetical protein
MTRCSSARTSTWTPEGGSGVHRARVPEPIHHRGLIQRTTAPARTLVGSADPVNEIVRSTVMPDLSVPAQTHIPNNSH